MYYPFLYVVLLGVIIFLIARLIPTNSSQNLRQSELFKEMEEAFDHFSSEMDEGNEKLIELIENRNAQHANNYNKLEKRIEYIESKLSTFNTLLIQQHTAPDEFQQKESKKTSSSSSLKTIPNIQNQTKKPPKPQKTVSINLKERYTELFELHQQNKSMDYIAKKLGMNKGEVQLIIQLNRQEDQLND